MGNKNDSTDAQSDREIVITRIFNARRELVFKAWTEPKHMSTGGVRKPHNPCRTDGFQTRRHLSLCDV
jgi:hypothetical protein